MDPISLIVIVVVVGSASIYLNRKWQARQTNEEAPSTLASAKEGAAALLAQTSSQAQALGSRATDRVKSVGSQAASQAQALGSQAVGLAQPLRERIPFGKPKSSLPADFRAWVVQATADEPDLRNWLAGLTDSQFSDFTDNVADFCTSTGFELEWLVYQEFSLMPQLAEDGGQVVVNYCRACLQAAGTQIALGSFRDYREYLQNPGSRKGRAYGEALLDRLLEAGLTSVSLADFLGASPKSKQEQVFQAIQSATEKDQDAFNRVLTTMNTVEKATPVSKETAMPEAAAA